jgi:hypothetical protein
MGRTPASAAADLRFALSDRLTLFAQPGLAADLFTVDQPAPRPNDERWMVRPMGTLGLVFGPGR